MLLDSPAQGLSRWISPQGYHETQRV